VATAPAPTPLLATVPPARSESNPSNWHTWAGVSLAAAGAGVLAWGIVWIAVDKNKIGANTADNTYTQYHTGTAGWILAGAGAAAIAGGAVVIFFTGHHPSEPAVALGLTPSSLLLQGRF
jgi:hypothetical protein